MKHTEELINYHFESLVNDKGNTVSTVLRLTGEEMLLADSSSKDKRVELAKFYRSLKRKYSFRMDYPEDFIQVFAVCFVDACNELEELEPLDELLKDEKLYNTRIRFIKSCIENSIPYEVNPDAQRISVAKDENGNAIRKTVTLYGDTSINQMTSNADGEINEIVTMLGEENQLFTYGGQSHYTHFIQWFLDNKERLLTKNQLEKYEMLKDIYVPAVDNSSETHEVRQQMYEQVGMTKQHFQSIKNSINKRVVKKYEEEFDNKNKYGFSTKGRKQVRQVFEEFVEVCDSPMFVTAYTRQCEVSKIVANVYDSYVEFEQVATKGLTLEEKKNIVRCVKGKELLTHRVIRLINNNIKEHLESIKDIEVKPAMQEWHGYSERTFDGAKDSKGKYLSIMTDGSLKEDSDAL